MDWNDLRIFLAVARTGSFGAAARRLGISHPTVSRRLQALEDALGQKLFQRIDHSLVVTDEGASIISLAEQIEDAAVGIERRMAGVEGTLEGVLRIATADWFGSWILPTAIEAFHRAHPGVTIELMAGARVRSLARREADIAFRVVPFHEPDVLQRRLLSVSFAVYTGIAGPETINGSGTGLHIIEDVPTETYPDVGWLRRRLPDATVTMRANNRTVQARSCAAGCGITLLPRAIGDAMPDLRRLDLGELPPDRILWMGYHRDLRMLGRLRAFVDIVTKHLYSNEQSADQA
ncbi:LysR family transcriptional regulator [Rhizosaccharibacter radicis]|uniref:LysR family transcriptional regulator n=1 Tax=Rhizosaccharibacter radicis TaxID=2782605 RepID=A0ABT1VZA0_9PROT|nr:LysR family transcriptional regulator [Acetobacteraceae bacterium KSS12]